MVANLFATGRAAKAFKHQHSATRSSHDTWKQLQIVVFWQHGSFASVYWARQSMCLFRTLAPQPPPPAPPPPAPPPPPRPRRRRGPRLWHPGWRRDDGHNDDDFDGDETSPSHANAECRCGLFVKRLLGNIRDGLANSKKLQGLQQHLEAWLLMHGKVFIQHHAKQTQVHTYSHQTPCVKGLTVLVYVWKKHHPKKALHFRISIQLASSKLLGTVGTWLIEQYGHSAILSSDS